MRLEAMTSVESDVGRRPSPVSVYLIKEGRGESKKMRPSVRLGRIGDGESISGSSGATHTLGGRWFRFVFAQMEMESESGWSCVFYSDRMTTEKEGVDR